jgi:hypothetical protein
MCSAALGVGAVAAYVAQTPSLHNKFPAVAPALTPSPSAPPTTELLPPPKAGQTVIVFVPTMSADGITFARQNAPVPDGEDAKLVAINEFLKASQIAAPDAKALSVEMQSDGSAVVTFNSAFDQTYGSFDEKKMLDGLAATMGQFPEVDHMTLFVGGKRLTTLGSADLSAPTPVIRPDAVPTKPLPTNRGSDERVKP